MTSSDGDRARAAGPPGRAPRRWSLRNWRVRSRLVALIAVPTVVAVALGALGVGGALAGAAAYARVGTLAGVASAVTATVGDLQREQAESAAFVGAGRTADRARAVTDAQRRTDAGLARLREAAAGVGNGYPQSTRDRLRRALFRLDTLPALRSAVSPGRFPAGVTVDRYTTVVTDLLALDDEIAQEGTDPELSASVRALGALSRARAALATQRALLESAFLAGRFDPGGAEALTRAIAAQDSALDQFRTSAPSTQSQRYDDVVAGPDVDQTNAIRAGITAGRPPAGGAAAAGSWEASASGALDKVGRVESGLVTAVTDRAAQLRSDQQRQALVIGILALVVILVVLLATLAVARSLVRPLRTLRDGALAVAERRLPETVARLGREGPDAVDTRVEPIAVHTADEIGEVARSFDAVHSEAVRAAAGEARRREQAGALFVILSRRTQSLVDRQIELIDDLEQGEQDADRLDSLFRLDHLATRMRRNGENLLVLGGQEPVRRWNRRLPLLEVLRAALSEVEQYPRIDLDEVPELTVAEGAVSDVVHLLAELLDNATAFSSRASRVRVVATALPDGSALVEITDQGIGLTADECEELGRRLATPSDVDVDASRRMGLYVVGRLAARLDARVWLRPGEPRGVTASVTLPASVLTEPVPEPVAAAGPAGAAGRDGSDGSWIGERFSRAVATPGPGADSWFGGAPLAASTPSSGPDAVVGSDAGSSGVAAFVPTASGVTDAGLPQRLPGANEVPGTRSDEGPAAGAPTRSTGRHAAPDPAPDAGAEPQESSADRSPDAIRRRYGSYQRGRRQARTGEPTAPEPDGTGTPVAAPGGTDPVASTAGAGAHDGDAGTGDANGSDVRPVRAAGAAAAGPGPDERDTRADHGTESTTRAGARGDAPGPGSDERDTGAVHANENTTRADGDAGTGTGAGVGGVVAGGVVAGGVVAGGAVVAGAAADPAGDDGHLRPAPAPGTGPPAGDGRDIRAGDGHESGIRPAAAPGTGPPSGDESDIRAGDAHESGVRPAAAPSTGPPAGDGRDIRASDGHEGGIRPAAAPGTGAPGGDESDIRADHRDDGGIRAGVPAGTTAPNGAAPVGAAPDATAPDGAAADGAASGAPSGTAAGGTAAGGTAPGGGPGRADGARDGPVPTPDVPWAAAAVREPTAAGATSSGLPLRAPGANYVPGSASDPDGDGSPGGTAGGLADGDADRNGAGADVDGRPEWDRSAEAIRQRFAAHQEGRRRAMKGPGT